MYSWKSVETRTPALTGYSCKDFPSRTTQSHLLLRKDKIRPNIWPEIPKDLSLCGWSEYQTLMKALDILRALVQVASIPIKASIPVPQDLLTTLALLPDTAVGKSTVDREDLKPYWKSEC